MRLPFSAGEPSRLIPARRARISRASRKLTFSNSETKVKTSPFLPHDQQRKFCHFGSTWRDGRVSLWNGQIGLVDAAGRVKR